MTKKSPPVADGFNYWQCPDSSCGGIHFELKLGRTTLCLANIPKDLILELASQILEEERQVRKREGLGLH
jgi:hypothetical protein